MTTPNRLILLSLITLSASAAALGQDAQSKTLNRAQRQYLDHVRPVIQQYCGDCHWGDETEAELNFEPYRDLDELLSITDQWKKAIARVNADEMPPGDAEPLPPAQKAQLLEWMDLLVNNIDCTDLNPGQPVIRRLNRTEYRNTIRDLTGVDFQPASSFPGDDVGYGFDNIGETLSLPPILLEKYLDAAERIAYQAIKDYDRPILDAEWSGAGLELDLKRAGRAFNGTLFLAMQAGAFREFELPSDARIELTVLAYQSQGGKEDAQMSVYLDNNLQETFTVAAGREQPGSYKTDFSVAAGKHQIKLTFDNDYYLPAQEGRKAIDRNLHIQHVAILGIPIDSPDDNRAVVFAVPPETDSERAEFAGEVIERFASRAFRRPATNQEITRLSKLYQQARNEGDTFAEAMRLVVKATLVSPKFLFRVEGSTEPGASRNLNAFELASATSYFLWSSMPDNELLQLATSGELKQPGVYRQQVERMLGDRRSRALIENFAAQWLQLRALPDLEPDPKLFPGVDRELLEAMIGETKMYVLNALKKDLSILSLLESRQTFVNQRLATHYGIEDVRGDQFVPVELPNSRSGGLLTQASILTLTSNPTRTSPVKRGKWIMENLLGDEPPPPDPSVMQLEDQPELTGTLRERMEQHRKNPACASCHQTMDALGFALENFDAVGRWRETDEELPINATGSLPDGTSFTGAVELQRLLKNEMREPFIRCVTEKMLIYAIGRGLQYYDQCAVDRIVERLKQNDYRFSELILAITESEPFQRRRGLQQNNRPNPNK